MMTIMVSQELEVSIVSIIFVRMLMEAGYFDQSGNPEDDIIMIAELISHLVTIINVNTHPLHDTYARNQVSTH